MITHTHTYTHPLLFFKLCVIKLYHGIMASVFVVKYGSSLGRYFQGNDMQS